MTSAFFINPYAHATSDPVPSAVPIYKTTLTSTSNVASGSSYTFSTVDVGVAHSKRIVIIGHISPSGSTGIPLIGGTSATNVASDGSAAGFNLSVAPAPTGTTLDIEIPIIAGTAARCVVAVWIAYPNSITKVDSGNDTSGASGTTDAVASDIAVVPGGFLIAWGGQISTVGSFTGTWSGIDTPVEDVDATLEATTSYAGWSMATTETASGGDFTMAESVSGQKELCVASWGASP